METHREKLSGLQFSTQNIELNERQHLLIGDAIAGYNDLIDAHNELLERLKECEESLLFYANNKNLHGSKSSIIYERCEVNGSYCLDLGNRAGLYFKKYEGKQ